MRTGKLGCICCVFKKILREKCATGAAVFAFAPFVAASHNRADKQEWMLPQRRSTPTQGLHDMKFIVPTAVALLLAVPASAQTTPIVLQVATPDRVNIPATNAPVTNAPATNAPATNALADARVTQVVEAACARPFIRDLKAQQVYRACMAEVRGLVEARLATSQALPVTVALR
jgi:hypothetical protein